MVVVKNLHELTQIDGVGDKVNEEGVGVDTDMVSKLSTLDNNETDEAGTKTGNDNNNTNKGKTAMSNDTEPNKRELILGVLSSDNLTNEMSGVRVSPEVSVEICLGTDSTSGGTSSITIGVKIVVGVESTRHDISVITDDWTEGEGVLLGALVIDGALIRKHLLPKFL